MIKNENINEESIKAMKEFKKKQIQTNIKLHIIFFILILLINIGLIFFIIIYKSKISEIKLKTNKNSSLIDNDKDSLIRNQNEISHKIVNILASSFDGKNRFSFIFDSTREALIAKNYIVDFYKTKNVNLDSNKFFLYFRYQSIVDGDSFSSLKDGLYYGYNNLILIWAENIRFGFFIQDDIILDEDDKFVYKDNNCFLFSLQKEGLFKCIGDKKKLKINNDDDGILTIGDGDIIIKNNFLQMNNKLGVINYPFKSFDISTINENIFSKKNGEIKINAIEIFIVDFNI